jgi:hypothetical protein
MQPTHKNNCHYIISGVDLESGMHRTELALCRRRARQIASRQFSRAIVQHSSGRVDDEYQDGVLLARSSVVPWEPSVGWEVFNKQFKRATRRDRHTERLEKRKPWQLN